MHRYLPLSLLVVAGCFPKAGPPPGPVSAPMVALAQGRWPDATEQSIARGRELFMDNCSNCHDFPDRLAIAEDKWPEIAERMARKADLEPADGQLVMRFILAERAAAQNPAPAR